MNQYNNHEKVEYEMVYRSEAGENAQLDNVKKEIVLPSKYSRPFLLRGGVCFAFVVIITIIVVLSVELIQHSSSGSATSSNSTMYENKVRLTGFATAGAIVTADGGYTIDNGGFDFYVNYPSSSDLILQATTAADFVPGFGQIDYLSTVQHYFSEVSMVGFGVQKHFWLPDGVNFTFDNGFGGTGNVSVPSFGLIKNISSTFRFAVIPASASPGTLESFNQGTGSTGILQSVGIYYWDVIDATGALVSLSANQRPTIQTGPITLHAPIIFGNVSDFSLWSFHGSAGRWSDPVQLTFGYSAQTEVHDFKFDPKKAGFWNIARPFSYTGCVIGYIYQDANKALPCAGMEITAQSRGPYNDGVFLKTHSTESGYFCMNGPLNWKPQVFYYSSDVMSAQSFDHAGYSYPYFTGQTGTCGQPSTCVEWGYTAGGFDVGGCPSQGHCASDLYDQTTQCMHEAEIALETCLADSQAKDDDTVEINYCYCNYYKTNNEICYPNFISACCIGRDGANLGSRYTDLCNTVLTAGKTCDSTT